MSQAVKSWVKAFRLRTLPLAAASIGLGSFVAAQHDGFRLPVLILSLATAFAFQILSNLANDYGDFSHGADNDGRVGPERALQSGAISIAAMRRAIGIAIAVSMILTACLSIIGSMPFGVPEPNWFVAGVFFAMGLVCILAAVTYTAGSIPYGYRGFGDVSVFVFFGLAGVAGCYYLHTGTWRWEILMPAALIGFLCMGVLNVNNMRDHLNDAAAGKRTLVVRIGFRAAKAYHAALVFTAVALSLWYMLQFGPETQSLARFVYLVLLAPLTIDVVKILRCDVPAELDPFLKKLAICTLLMSLGYGLCLQVT